MVHLTGKEKYMKKRTLEYMRAIAIINKILEQIDKMHEKVPQGSLYTGRAKEQLLKTKEFYERSIEKGDL